MAKRINKDTVLQIFGVTAAILGLAFTIFIIAKFIRPDKKSAKEIEVTTYTPSNKKETSVITSGGKTFKIKDNMDVILVMGVDDVTNTGETQLNINSSQADALYVLAIDHDNKTYQAIQINRESMADVQTYTVDGKKNSIVNMQICLAHTYGSNDNARCLNTVDAVSGLLFNVPIKHYIALNLSSIEVLNDQVGGVTVTVPAGMENADPEFREGSQITLKGKQAERFVRVRTEINNDSNEFRMQRQEIFIKAWKDKAKAKLEADSGFAPKMVLALSEYMTSDMTANNLSELSNKLKEYKDLGTVSPKGETLEENEERLFREFHIDMEDLQQKVKDIFYEEVPSS